MDYETEPSEPSSEDCSSELRADFSYPPWGIFWGPKKAPPSP